MKLFISWSGEFSRKVAERLSIWIPTIIQTVEVFYSPDDIAKGENWGNRLSEELEQSNFGIVCLTPENVLAPWIHFEAGALSKASNSRVSAIMLGINPSDVKGPLSRLQNTAFDRDDFFRLFQSINNSSGVPLKPEILKNAFDSSWKKLMDDIGPIIKDYTSLAPTSEAGRDKRKERSSDSDALQEILRLVRNLDNSRTAPAPWSASTVNSSFQASSKITEDEIVYFTGSKEHLTQALPIIKDYIRSGTAKPSIEHALEDFWLCSARIPQKWLDALKQHISVAVPEIGIVVV